MKQPRTGPSLRTVACTLAGAVLALAYDVIALLPLWAAANAPLRWSAAVQDLSRPLRVGLALASLAALWWGLYGIHSAKAVLHQGSARPWDRVVLWSGVAIVVAMLSFPGFLPG